MDYSFVKSLHGNFGILAFLLLIVLFLRTLYDFINKNEKLGTVRKISKYTTLTVHIQLILGVVFLIMNSFILENLSGKIAGSSVSYIEHMASNLIAIVLITIFNAKLKRADKITPSLLVILVVSMVLLSRVVPLIMNILK
ncbi:MAG: hypothetical protein H6604_04130 [Flavobacteriales bacterium]|nr:hypothetical protein [Flavobacteriales bacterium]